MPRGDGTGPAGGRGRGRRYGQGCGQRKRAASSRRTAADDVTPSPAGALATTSETLPHAVAVVDDAACNLCGACHAVCPTNAIRVDGAAATVLAEACRGCGACVDVCPTGAIKLS